MTLMPTAQDLMFGTTPLGTAATQEQMLQSLGNMTRPDGTYLTSRLPTNVGGIGAANPTGLGLNLPTAQLAMTGLGTIGNLWAAFQAQKIAKQQLATARDFGEANLTNQIQSYNTALADRARSRGFVEGQSPEQTQAYIDENRLTRNRT